MNQLLDNKIIYELPVGLFFYRFEYPNKLFLISGNYQAELLTGIKIDKHLKKEFNEIWQEAQSNGITDAFLETMHTGIPYTIDQKFYSDDKVRGIFKIKAFKVNDNTLCVSFDEVSKIIDIKDAYNTTENKYKTLLDNVFDAVFLLNQNKLEYFNYRFCEITGFDYQEILNPEFEFKSLLHINSLYLFEEYCRLLMQGLKNNDTYTLEVIKKNGDVAIVEINAKLIGKPSDLKILAIMRDITEKMKIIEALKESEFKYKTVVENTHEGIAIIQNEKFVFVNSTLINMSEKPTEDFLNHSIYEFIYPEDHKSTKETISAKLSGQITDQKYRLRYLALKGRIVWLEVSSVVINWKNEPALLLFITDIQEKIEVQEKLTLTQAIWQSALEQSNIGIVISTPPDCLPLFISKTAKQILGIEESDFISTHTPPYPHKWYATDNDGRIIPASELPLTKALKHSVTTPFFEHKIFLNDGPIKYISGSSAPVFNEANDLIAGILVFQDITEIKKYQEEIRDAKEKLTLFIQNAEDMIYFISADEKITMLNNAHTHITGYSKEDFERNPDLWEKIMLPEDIESANEFFRNNPEGVPYHTTEYRIETKNGKWKWLQTRMIGIWGKDNKFLGYNCIDRDITELKEAWNEVKTMNIELEARVKERTNQLEDMLYNLNNEIKIRQITEQQLLLAQQELSEAFQKEKELSELKTRFITMISHEYRTPLTVIMTSSYLLEQLYFNQNLESFTKHLEKIRVSVKTMTKLLEDVLTLGKSESGKLTLKPTSFDIIPICFEIIDEIKLIDNKQHTINFSSNNHNCHIINDEKLLRQIIINLLSNAVKYSPINSEIKLEVIEDSNQILIKIRDSGIGIRPEDQKYLFEPFHRGKNVGTISGTGLGLSIVKRCLDLMGGKIYLKSDITGTTFTIKIPQNILENRN